MSIANTFKQTLNIPYARLVNQRLVGSKLDAPEKVVAWMGAMQAQDYPMVKWGIGNRLTKATDSLVEQALLEGKIVRTHILRPTWHLVAAEDLRWMLALTAPRIKLTIHGYMKQLAMDPKILHKTNEIITSALEGNKHKTRHELGDIIRQAGIENNSHHIAQIMAYAELDGIVCSGAPKGKTQTYALVDEWIPKTNNLTKDETLGKLAFNYFRSHAPATLHDFVWWSGLSVIDARKAIEIIKTDFMSVEISEQSYWIKRDFDDSKLHDEQLLLLPAFDEYLVSYKNRMDVLAHNYLRKIISSNGIFRPSIIYKGQVVGSWKKNRSKKNTTIESLFFEKPTNSVLNLFEKPPPHFFLRIWVKIPLNKGELKILICQ